MQGRCLPTAEAGLRGVGDAHQQWPNAICCNFARQYKFGEGHALIDDTKACLADLDVAHGARRDSARRGAPRPRTARRVRPKSINKYHKAKACPAPSQDVQEAAPRCAYTLDIAWAVQTTVTVTAVTLEDAHAQARALKYGPKIMPSVPLRALPAQ